METNFGKCHQISRRNMRQQRCVSSEGGWLSWTEYVSDEEVLSETETKRTLVLPGIYNEKISLENVFLLKPMEDKRGKKKQSVTYPYKIV